MNVGQRIQANRIKLGLSQTELAEKIGTTKQNIYKYEKGIVTNIPSDKLEQLAKILETTPAYLMGWDEADQQKSASEEASEASPSERRVQFIARRTGQLPEKEREKVLDLFESTLDTVLDALGIDEDER